MNEQKIIAKQLIKNMLLNLIAFTIIFSIFGLIVYSQVATSIYKSADEELLNNRNRYGIIKKLDDKPDLFQENRINRQEKIEVNPRLIYIIRDENGLIKSDENPQIEYFQDILSSVKFDINDLDRIYEVQLENYKYRGINYKLNQDGETTYIQVLINVDAEEDILHNFSKTLVISIAVIILLSIIASYILSKRSLKPIMDAWKKQTEFVQNASHELRTPLTIIQAKQELLLEAPNSKIIDKAEEITISLNETRRLSKLVKDLMVLARSDANEDILHKENMYIDNEVKKIVAPYIDLAKMQNKKVKLNLNYKKEIKLDKDKISQLFIIILDNSIKYTEEDDEIEIHTYEKDNKCHIDIIDTGIGISDETITHMFDRFYREDKARLRQTGGSGLGLCIARTIVEAHGGNIKAGHNEKKGTIISIVLPK